MNKTGISTKIENTKKNQMNLKSEEYKWIEKFTEGLTNSLGQAEERISEFEYSSFEIMQRSKTWKEWRVKRA